MTEYEATEKIYVHRTVHLGLLAASEINITGNDVEYTCTDAFIDKACEWLEPVLKNLAGYYAGEDILGDFRKYMKGE